MTRGLVRKSALSLTVLACTVATAFAQSAPPPTPATPFAIGGPNTVSASAAQDTGHTGRTATGVRLYALDCGRLQLADMGMVSDTGEYARRPGQPVSPGVV